MTKRITAVADDAIENAIRTAGSIGALERLAGIPQDADSRYAFWTSFSHLPPAQSLDAGCDELKRRIRAAAAPRPS